ncbi:VanZ family protein [Dasania marina]|uniref:VanZ family protein n=1 Tax=Dasania marina TaxID=471499 RepID=UPI00036CA54B|nr:VanZ family protein [Dasania marina]
MLLCYRIVFYFTAVTVLSLSLLSLDEDFISTGWDKTNHLLAFFVLAALIDSAYPLWAYWRCKVMLLIAFGLLIEVLQFFTGYRLFSWLDLLADSLALCLFYPFRGYWAAGLRWGERLIGKSK